MHLLRRLCTEHGAVLIFDEVMTGFRVGPRGVQGLFGITPDLTTLGKVIGGGMPVGAFGGRRDIMEKIAPLGGVSGRHPVGQPGGGGGGPRQPRADRPARLLRHPRRPHRAPGGRPQCRGGEARRAFVADSVGGMFGLYFAQAVPRSYAEVMACDKERFNRFFHAMLDAGHYFAPSAFEAGFVSAAHSEADIDSTIAAAEAWFEAARRALKKRLMPGGGAGYIRKIVASPRKMKKPPESVTAVMITLEPTAGSCPRRLRIIGAITPTKAASSRLRVIAAVITAPSLPLP
jgi:glutamate-1-semialdehyde 2,1-aminomutase